jgi:hypothetical protein
MRSPFRTAAAAVSVAAMFAGTAALSAAPASAATDKEAPHVVSAVLNNNVAVIKVKGHDVIRVEAHVTDNVGVTEVWAPLYSKGQVLEVAGQPVIIPLRKVSGTAQDGVWVQRFWPTVGDRVGVLQVGVLAFDAAKNYGGAGAGNFRVKNDTRVVTFTVTPKHSQSTILPITLAGRLQVVGLTGWKGFAGRDLIVQFRQAGTSTWTRVMRLKTDVAGNFSTDKIRSAAGSFRVIYKGSSTTDAAVSVGRKVTVG